MSCGFKYLTVIDDKFVERVIHAGRRYKINWSPFHAPEWFMVKDVVIIPTFRRVDQKVLLVETLEGDNFHIPLPTDSVEEWNNFIISEDVGGSYEI